MYILTWSALKEILHRISEYNLFFSGPKKKYKLLVALLQTSAEFKIAPVSFHEKNVSIKKIVSRKYQVECANFSSSIWKI